MPARNGYPLDEQRAMLAAMEAYFEARGWPFSLSGMGDNHVITHLNLTLSVDTFGTVLDPSVLRKHVDIQMELVPVEPEYVDSTATDAPDSGKLLGETVRQLGKGAA